MRIEQRIASWLPWLPLLLGVALAATASRSATRPAYAPAAARTFAHPQPAQRSVRPSAAAHVAEAAASTPRRASRWLALALLGIVAPVVVPAASSAWFTPAGAPAPPTNGRVVAAGPEPQTVELGLAGVVEAPAALATEPPAASASTPIVPAYADAQVVSFYGYPGEPVMGILGSYEPEDAARAVVEFVEKQAIAGSPRPVPALHLIVGVAQAKPQADGSYLARMDSALIERYARATREQGALLFLDVQVGWSDAVSEVRRLEPFLREPHVQLALDPEFATRATGRAPGEVIGTLSADEVNGVQRYLAALVQREHLPRKLLVLHQFMDHMLTGQERYEAHPEVEITIDMDGYGGAAAKLSKYELYALGEYSERPAIKLFFDWDAPVLTPADLAGLPTPPGLVIYQ